MLMITARIDNPRHVDFFKHLAANLDHAADCVLEEVDTGLLHIRASILLQQVSAVRVDVKIDEETTQATGADGVAVDVVRPVDRHDFGLVHFLNYGRDDRIFEVRCIESFAQGVKTGKVKPLFVLIDCGELRGGLHKQFAEIEPLDEERESGGVLLGHSEDAGVRFDKVP